jgi:hypothetical protein
MTAAVALPKSPSQGRPRPLRLDLPLKKSRFARAGPLCVTKLRRRVP